MKKNLILNILLVIFLVIFLVSGFFLARYFIESRRSQNDFDELAQIVSQAQEPEPSQEAEPAPGEAVIPQPETVTVTNPRTGQQMDILKQYAELFSRNSDLVGWLKLEGTKINYPVMQTPDSKDYYLHRNFDKEYSAHGCFYVQENCDVFAPSDNLTIYGHNMKDGTMMKALHGYEKKSFWENHPVIQFDTLSEHHEYEVFAVFVTSATKGQGFAYNNFVDAGNEAQFEQFVFKCKDLSFYNTGITPQYGDKLITLSTCDYSVSNGRLVVVARQIPNS